MNYRRLGLAGVEVSAIGLGGNQFGRVVDEDRTAQIISVARELGVNFIDTAESYGDGRSEEFLGRALRPYRNDFVIASKTGMTTEAPGRLSRRQIVRRLEASLKRLGTDHLDVYYLHYPDPGTDPEETFRALDDLVRDGKILYPAISNYPAWQLAETIAICDRRNLAPPVVSQNQYNLLDRKVEEELLPAVSRFGLAVVPHSPLAGGFLTGKYKRGEDPRPGVRGHDNERFRTLWLRTELFDQLERYEAFAQSRGHTVSELAIAWLLAKPEVCSVIAGVTSTEQLRANVASGEWRLDPSELATISSA